MEVIPVIDLLHGQVVHARRGDRTAYRPLVTPWSRTAEPLDVANGLRDSFGFRRFYLADLDAIGGATPNLAVYREWKRAGFDLMLDAGIRDKEQAAALKATADSLVFGLETVPERTGWRELIDAFPGSECTERTAGSWPRAIFSLDLKNGSPLGIAAWTNDPIPIVDEAVSAGFTGLLVLDLASVGNSGGLGTIRLVEIIRRRHPKLWLAAGGGIRGPEDLTDAESIGLNAVLVATALHDGRLTPAHRLAFR